MRRIRSRGQALVLFGMLMLILVLAALATMSLAHLTQQKMEMQVANDTAAYSQAVAAARTYNSVALLNRAQVATMVALQGIHSAISFAGTYRGSINAAMYAYQDDFNKEFGKCTDWNYEFNFGNNLNSNSRNTCEIVDRIYDERSCQRAHPFNLNLIFININIPFLCSGEACDARREVMGEWGFLSLDCNMRLGGSGGRVPLLKDEWCRVKNIWDALDDPTGEQGRDAQAEAVALGELERVALTALPGGLAPLATKSVNVIGAQANVSVGVGEVARSYAGGGSYNGVEAALGSRAHPFISQRADGRRAIEDQLRRVVAPSGAPPDEIIVEPDFKGSSFFDQPSTNANRYSYSHGMREPQAYASWADEHGRVSVSYEGPRQNLRTPGVANSRHRRSFKGSQSATDEQHEGDTHEWCPADLNAESRDPYLRHTLLPHRMPPPNEYDPCQNTSCIWPGFYDANATLIPNADDVFGHPKLFTVASKDLAADKNPWNIIKPFRFARTGSFQRVDFTSKHALKGSGVVPDFQAMSAGMAYYHRPGHWKEHPNFFNPYWRATLVRSDVDGSWRADVTRSLAPVNSDAFNRLYNAGYRGIP